MKGLSPIEAQLLLVLLWLARTAQRLLVRLAINATAAAHFLDPDDYKLIVKEESTAWKQKHSRGGLTP